MKVLFIDNFDSFSFNLVDDLERRGADVTVWRNDIAVDDALELARAMPVPRLIVLSPGPGAPRDAGCCVPLSLAAADAAIPLFGVCLGHQAIVEAFGGTVGFAGEVVHGKTASITHDARGLFAGLPSPMRVARYHSLAATALPPTLRPTAHAKRSFSEPLIMAVEHTSARIAGVQFHPESILTPRGGLMIDNLLRWAG